MLATSARRVADEFIIPANLARGGEADRRKATCDRQLESPASSPAIEASSAGRSASSTTRTLASNLSPTDLRAPRRAALGRRGRCVRAELRPQTFRSQPEGHVPLLPVRARAWSCRRSFCLNPAGGTPVDVYAGANPDFHIPRRNGGAGDKPGGDAVVTIGLWSSVSDFVLVVHHYARARTQLVA